MREEYEGKNSCRKVSSGPRQDSGESRELAEEPAGVREDGSGDVQNGMPAPRLVVWRMTSGQRELALVEGRGEVASASYNTGSPSALGSPLIRIPGPSLHHPAFCTKFTAINVPLRGE